MCIYHEKNNIEVSMKPISKTGKMVIFILCACIFFITGSVIINLYNSIGESVIDKSNLVDSARFHWWTGFGSIIFGLACVVLTVVTARETASFHLLGEQWAKSVERGIKPVVAAVKD